MKNLLFSLSLFLVIVMVSCGDLEKDIEIELPEYEEKLVIECYLEVGQPYYLTVIESSSYFDTFGLTIISDATVTIDDGEYIDTLIFFPFIDPTTGKAYNYFFPRIVAEDYGKIYRLNVSVPDGREAFATTQLLPPVDIDEMRYLYNESGTAALCLTTFTDDLSTVDYYRRMLHLSSLDSSALQDFVLDDTFDSDGSITTGSPYEFVKGDTLISTVYHIDKGYHDFLQSIEDAQNANGNPFAQPAQIKSNVEGGLGVFATLSYRRDTLVIDE